MATDTKGKTREQMIQDLREFAEALQSSEATTADLQSLDKAAEVVALYENRTIEGEPLDRKWQDEVPAPKKRRGSGGAAEQANSFERFISKWASDRVGLKRSHLGKLRRAHEVSLHLPTAARGDREAVGVQALNPLNYFIREDKSDEISKVWGAAQEIAQDEGRGNPTEAIVKKALSDWKKDNLPKTARGAKPKETPRRKVKSLEGELRRWVSAEPTLTVPMLRQVLADFEAKAASTPPVEEWSS